jgi:hypothetical protein
MMNNNERNVFHEELQHKIFFLVKNFKYLQIFLLFYCHRAAPKKDSPSILFTNRYKIFFHLVVVIF